MNDEQDLMTLARKRTDMKMGLLTHALVFACVNGGLWLMSELTGRHHHFFPLWGWALGLSIHAIVVACSLGGVNLRERLMQQELERLRRRG